LYKIKETNVQKNKPIVTAFFTQKTASAMH